MKWRYHAFVNFLILGPIAYFTHPIYIDWLMIAIIISAISGHLPDFDLILAKIGPWMHRDIVWHSFIIPAIITAGSLFLGDELIRYYISLLSIGYGFHLLFDFFPKLQLRGFGLIHIFTDAKPEDWSIRWLTAGFFISIIIGTVEILMFILF